MSGRIGIPHRIILTVRIPVQAQRVVIPSRISILRNKPSGRAVIVARIFVYIAAILICLNNFNDMEFSDIP